jgi:hypothetical protein
MFFTPVFLGSQFCVAGEMEAQSGISEINAGDNAINRGMAEQQSLPEFIAGLASEPRARYKQTRPRA